MTVLNVFQLIGSALIPVVVCCVFFTLERVTKFKNLPYWTRQVIIGVVFGLCAIFGTEFGVDVGGGVKANVRDAAPLIAGLFFSGPAGIIAGAIGGVERFVTDYIKGVQSYTQVACSISTVIAGLYAVGLRKFIFKNNRPSWFIGFTIGVAMEALHLTIVFITHLDNPIKSLDIIKILGLPMILANAASVMVSIICINFISNKIHKRRYEKYKKLSQQIQRSLMIVILITYLSTTTFAYIFQTNLAKSDALELLTFNIEDICKDVKEKTDEELIKTTRKIQNEYIADPDVSLDWLCAKYQVDEISFIDNSAIIVKSSVPEYVGFDMTSGEQADEFNVLLGDEVTELVQEYMPATDGSGSKKYAGIKVGDIGYIQAGYYTATFQEKIRDRVSEITGHRRVGTSGYVLIIDANFNVLTNSTEQDDQIKKLDLANKEEGQLYETRDLQERSLYTFLIAEGFYVMTVIPTSEAYRNRDDMIYLYSFMEILAFTVLFGLTYSFIERLVVSKIRNVNEKLKLIIDGDLDVTVDVHSSTEFIRLSDSINSTVQALKGYIDEAASRIDKELAFAKSIQLSSLPSVFPAFPNNKEFDIYATMDTAKEVGGDFYDFYMLDNDRLAFLIADVSGKGIPAAMFMMRAKTMIKNLAEAGYETGEIFTRANEKLCEGNEAGMFVTAWLGILDIKTGHVEYVNGGHNPPLVYNKETGWKYLQGKAGFVLAGFEGFQYRKQELDLAPGDRIYLYTDGVTESTNDKNELYGEERLINFLSKNNDLSCQMTLKSIKDDLDRFDNGADQFDDITMVILDYNGASMIENTYLATDENLTQVLAFVEEELEKFEVSMAVTMKVTVAVEEIYVNVAHYAYGDKKGDVKVGFDTTKDSIIIRFKDSGIPFNPLEKADPDITLAAEDRNIGGLGIYMVKQIFDEVKYEYVNGENILLLKKKVK